MELVLQLSDEKNEVDGIQVEVVTKVRMPIQASGRGAKHPSDHFDQSLFGIIITPWCYHVFRFLFTYTDG